MTEARVMKALCSTAQDDGIAEFDLRFDLVAFGYGHWEYGARKHRVGGRTLGGDPKRAKGVLLSGMSLVDPTFKEPFGHSDMASGAPARNGGAYRLEKI